MRTSRRALCLLLIFCLLTACLPVTASAESETYFETVRDNVALWDEYGDENNVLDHVTKEGTTLRLIKTAVKKFGFLWLKHHTWYYVHVESGCTDKGKSGDFWVYSNNVTEHQHSFSGVLCTSKGCPASRAFDLTTKKTNLTVLVDDAPLRLQPYIDGTVIKTLKKGDVITAIGELTNYKGSKWYKIAAGDQYIYAGNVGITTEIKSNSRNNSLVKGGGSTDSFLNDFLIYRTAPCKTHRWSMGKCVNCGATYPLNVQSASGTYVTSVAFAAARDVPYRQGKVMRTYDPVNNLVEINGKAVNSANETWYRTKEGYWIYDVKLSNLESVQITMHGSPTLFYTVQSMSDRFSLTCVPSPTRAVISSLMWSSSNPAVATVSSDGVVTPKGAGKTTVTCTATSAEGTKKYSSIQITVPALITLPTWSYDNQAYHADLAMQCADYMALAYPSYNYMKLDGKRIVYKTSSNPTWPTSLLKLLAENNLNYYVFNYDHKTQLNSPHVIAETKVNYQGKETPLVYVIIEGSAGEAGWCGNMMVSGTTYQSMTDHYTFLESAKDVEANLMKVIRSHTVKPLVVVTGHSRGAATANLLAHRLNSNSRVDKVYAYTFATPNTTKSPSADKNIFNICNEDDFVPYIPFSKKNGWDFQKHGITLTFRSGKLYSSNSTFKKYVNTEMAKSSGVKRNSPDYTYSSMSPGEMKTYLNGRWPNLKSYYSVQSGQYGTQKYDTTAYDYFYNGLAKAASGSTDGTLVIVGHLLHSKCVFHPVSVFFKDNGTSSFADCHEAFTYHSAMLAIGSKSNGNGVNGLKNMTGVSLFSDETEEAWELSEKADVGLLSQDGAEPETGENSEDAIADVAMLPEETAESETEETSEEANADVSTLPEETAESEAEENSEDAIADVAMLPEETAESATEESSEEENADAAMLSEETTESTTEESNEEVSVDVSTPSEDTAESATEETSEEANADVSTLSEETAESETEENNEGTNISLLSQETEEPVTGEINAEEYAALHEFFAMDENQLMLELAGWDVSDPKTWSGIRWDENGHVVEMDLSYMNLSGYLDVGALRELRTLNVDGNELTFLAVSDCAKLEELSCSFNELNALSVGDCGELVNLSCAFNNIPSLDVSNLSNLQALNCYGNQITALNLSGAAALESVRCGGNELAGVDISTNPNLSEFYCDGNRIVESAPDNAGLVQLVAEINEAGGTAEIGTQQYIEGVDFNEAELSNLAEFADSARNLEKLGWDLDDPWSWEGVEWKIYGDEYHIASLSLDGLGLEGDLNLPDAAYLESLSCNGSSLSTLSLENCATLSTLNCSDAGLSELDLTACEGLTTLHCDDNFLEPEELETTLSQLGLQTGVISYETQNIAADEDRFDPQERAVLLDLLSTGSNAELLGWDWDWPGTWSGIVWTKDEDGFYRVNRLDLTGTGITGEVDLTGFAYLEDFCFAGTQVRRVVLPDCITSIPPQAFFNSAIREVRLSNGVSRIGAGAFAGCADLQIIVLPATVTRIFDNAFFGCSSLENVVFLGDEPLELGENLFAGCSPAFALTISAGRQWDENGALLSSYFYNEADTPYLLMMDNSVALVEDETYSETNQYPGNDIAVTVVRLDENAPEDPVCCLSVYNEGGVLTSLDVLPVEMDGNMGVITFPDVNIQFAGDAYSDVKIFLVNSRETFVPVAAREERILHKPASES